MRAGAVFDELLSGDRRIRHRHVARNAEIGGDVEHPQPASGFGKLVFQIADVRIAELVQVQFRPLRRGCTTRWHRNRAPPVRGIPGRSPLRACCRRRSRWNRRAYGCRNASLWKKYSIPVGRYLKRWSRSDHTGVHSILAAGSNGGGVGVTSSSLGRAPVLRVAEQQDVVRPNGLAGREIGKAPRHPDLVALEDSGIALDRLHQRAGFALLGGAALAEAAAAPSRAQLMDRLGGPGEIMRGVEVGVERQVDFDPFELRHHAGERAHVLAVFRHRGPRRNAAVAAAGHDRLGAGGQHERHRLAARIAQLLAPT